MTILQQDSCKSYFFAGFKLKNLFLPLKFTKALRCNGFVAGPISLQLTGHPFAKPQAPFMFFLRSLLFLILLYLALMLFTALIVIYRN